MTFSDDWGTGIGISYLRNLLASNELGIQQAEQDFEEWSSLDL